MHNIYYKKHKTAKIGTQERDQIMRNVETVITWLSGYSNSVLYCVTTSKAGGGGVKGES